MTKLIPAIKKAALFFWAFAVLWIYIGSLVNFHQHKIWGRPLLPQLLFCKRDKEKNLNLSLSDPSSLHSPVPFNFKSFQGELKEEPELNASFTFRCNPFQDNDTGYLEYSVSTGQLRAPPGT